MTDYKQQQLERLEAFNCDAEREKLKAENPEANSIYPHLCGVLQIYVKEAISLAQSLKKDLDNKTRKLDAMQWAAESVLTDSEVNTFDDRLEVCDMLYHAAEIVEKAIEGGMTDDQLREHLKDGVTDEEYKQDRFLDADELCIDCEEFCGKDAERCEACQEVHEDSGSPAA